MPDMKGYVNGEILIMKIDINRKGTTRSDLINNNKWIGILSFIKKNRKIQKTLTKNLIKIF